MVYGYIRVSSDKQNLENQKYEIEKFCRSEGVKIDDWIEEKVSGLKSLNDRNLGVLLKKIAKNDLIICSEISRIGRSIFMIFNVLNFCLNRGAKVWTIKDNYRLGDDIQSKILAFAFGLSAEIERNLISQRTKEALNRKKSEGMILGRPKGSSKPEHFLLFNKEETILRLLIKGYTKTKISKILKVNRGTLYKFIKIRNINKEY